MTARSGKAAAERLALEIADRAWADYRRYKPHLTPLQEAIAAAVEAGQDPRRRPVILADVADNPGGGASGNTTFILEGLVRAGAKGAILACSMIPPWPRRRGVGEGASMRAVFNRETASEFSHRFEADAKVLRIRDGDCVGRRGFYAGRRLNLGTTALLDLGGVLVVVISIRTQCADPVFFEMMGIDIGRARSVTVKSRGHFRAGFDEFFGPEQVIEVDAPGLSSPVLSVFLFRHLPRPVFPLRLRGRMVPSPAMTKTAGLAPHKAMPLASIETPSLVLDRLARAQHGAHDAAVQEPRDPAEAAHEDRKVDRRGPLCSCRQFRRYHRLDSQGGGVLCRARHCRHHLRRQHRAGKAAPACKTTGEGHPGDRRHGPGGAWPSMSAGARWNLASC